MQQVLQNVGVFGQVLVRCIKKKQGETPYLWSIMQATSDIECCFTILAWLTCWHLIGFSRLVEQWTTFERHRAVYWTRYSWSSCVELKDEGTCPDRATHPVWNLRTKQEQLLDKGYIPLCSLRVMAPSLLLFLHPFSPHIREYKTVLDFGLHAKDSGFQELASDFMSVELGFWIPDFFSCISLAVFRNPKPRIPRIPQAKISRIPDSLI